MSEVPLKPVGREEIRKLELALVLGTLFRSDVLQQALEAHDKLTWLDSLLVAAGALARERAGLTVSKIAEELGRTEATIRSHLQGKTEAGKLVKQTYEELVKRGGVLELPLAALPASVSTELERLKKENDELKKEAEALRREVEELRNKLGEVKGVLQQLLQKLG